MEADAREPVWPPHASSNVSGNSGRRLVALQSVRSPMQHDGVSSSQVDSSENHSRSSGLGPGSPHLPELHGPRASYQGAEAQAWVPDDEPQSSGNEARAMTAPSPAPAPVPEGIISIPSNRRSNLSRYNNEAIAIASSTLPDSSIPTPPNSNNRGNNRQRSGEAVPRTTLHSLLSASIQSRSMRVGQPSQAIRVGQSSQAISAGQPPQPITLGQPSQAISVGQLSQPISMAGPSQPQSMGLPSQPNIISQTSSSAGQPSLQFSMGQLSGANSMAQPSQPIIVGQLAQADSMGHPSQAVNMGPTSQANNMGLASRANSMGQPSQPSSMVQQPQLVVNRAVTVGQLQVAPQSANVGQHLHVLNQAISIGQASQPPTTQQQQMQPIVVQPAVTCTPDEVLINAVSGPSQQMAGQPYTTSAAVSIQQPTLVQDVPTGAFSQDAPVMIQSSALIQQAIQGIVASVQAAEPPPQSEEPQIEPPTPTMLSRAAVQPPDAPQGFDPDDDDDDDVASEGGIEVSLVDAAETGSTPSTSARRRGRRSAQNVQNLVIADGGDALAEEIDPVDEEDFLKQGAIQRIVDRPITSRARATLPSMLQVFKIQDEVVGVFAKRSLPKRTQFGPLEGYIVHEQPPTSKLNWPVIRNGETVYIDCNDEFQSNWMGFVRPAETYSEQNLMAFCLDNEIYFATIKTIEPRQELKVWYAKSFAETLGVNVLEITPEEAAAQQEKEKTWPCFECSRKFKTSELLQKHLSTHEQEEVKPPRGRGRGRGRGRPKKRGRPRKYPTSDELRYKNAVGGGRGNSVLFQEKPQPFACGTCGKSFSRNYDLQRHAAVHTTNKTITCEVCYKKFAYDYNALRHLRKHKDKGEYQGFVQPPRHRQLVTTWLCEYCDESFNKEDLLVAHEEEKHAEEAARVPVRGVNPGAQQEGAAGTSAQEGLVSIGTPQNVLQPLPSISNLQQPPDFPATEATTMSDSIINGLNFVPQTSSAGAGLDGSFDSFYSEFGHLQHTMSMNSQGQTLIHCKICSKTFDNQSLYNAHVKIHMIPKFYKCPFCEIGYERPELLRRHVMIHKQNGKYICPHCSASFEMYSQIRKHLRENHSCKEFPCPGCDKIFSRPDKLKMHMLKHTDRKDFLCANCGKQFKRKDKLKEHMLRMHNPEREAKMAALANRPKKLPFKPAVDPTEVEAFTFKCRACQLGFKRRGMLVNHLARQHPEIQPESVPELNLPIIKPNRNYFCAYCEKVYKSSSKRKIHIIKNHPGALLPPSLRKNKNAAEMDTLDDPHTAPAGSTTTHYFACAHCPRQYSTKAKMMDHVRKKHMDPVTSGGIPQQQISVVEPAVHLVAQVDDQNTASVQRTIRPANSTNTAAAQVMTTLQGLPQGAQAMQPTVQLVVAPGATPEQISQQIQEAQAALNQERVGDSSMIRYIDISQLAQAESSVQATDLLNQAMSELQHTIQDSNAQQSVSDLVQRILPQIQQQQQQQQQAQQQVQQPQQSNQQLLSNQSTGHIQIPASLAQQLQGAQIIQQPNGQVVAISADGSTSQTVDLSQLIQIGPAAQTLTQAAMAAALQQQQQQLQQGGGQGQTGPQIQQIVQVQNIPQTMAGQQGQTRQQPGVAVSSQDRQQSVILPAGWSYQNTQQYR